MCSAQLIRKALLIYLGEEPYGNARKAPPNDDDGQKEIAAKWLDVTDVFVAYSTMPGYTAYGGDADGSIYLQALAQLLKQHYRTRDLSKIYLMIKQVMAREAQGNTVQPAEERNGLRYLVKFGDFNKNADRDVSCFSYYPFTCHAGYQINSPK